MDAKRTREADTRSGHAKRTREADTRVPLAPLSGGARTRESTVRAINHTYAHVISVDCCHNRGLLPQPWTVAATVDCCRNRGLLPQPWIVAATVDCCRNRGFSPEPWFLGFPKRGQEGGRRAVVVGEHVPKVLSIPEKVACCSLSQGAAVLVTPRASWRRRRVSSRRSGWRPSRGGCR